MKWISVKKELPDYDEIVLVKNQFDGPFFALYQECECGHGGSWNIKWLTVSHKESGKAELWLAPIFSQDFKVTHWKYEEEE